MPSTQLINSTGSCSYAASKAAGEHRFRSSTPAADLCQPLYPSCIAIKRTPSLAIGASSADADPDVDAETQQRFSCRAACNDASGSGT